MFEDLYDYNHPSLYMHLVESGGMKRARRCLGKHTKTQTWYRRAGPRKVRRAIKRYLRFADTPRIDNYAAGDSWEVY
jgi:hypothetical protein